MLRIKKHIILKNSGLKFCFTTIALLVLPILLFAQPCADPDDPVLCPPQEDAPLDTWVFLLVFLILGLTVWYYYKQKKSLRTL